MNQYNAKFLQALAEMLAPTAIVTCESDRMEVKVNGALLGYITMQGIDDWCATRFETRLDTKRRDPYAAQDTYGPVNSASKAMRFIFGVSDKPDVTMREGVCAGEQESSFMNATLQNAGETISFSVATELAIPEYVQSKGEAMVATYVKDMLGRASTAVPGLSFEVEVGPTEDPEED